MWNPATITALIVAVVAAVGAVVVPAITAWRGGRAASAALAAHAANPVAHAGREELVFHGPDCPGHTTGLPGASCLRAAAEAEIHPEGNGPIAT